MFPIPSPCSWDRHRGHLFCAIAGGGCRPRSLHPKELQMAPAQPSHRQQQWPGTSGDELYAAAAEAEAAVTGGRGFGAAESSPPPSELIRIGALGNQGGPAGAGGDGLHRFLFYAAGRAPAAGQDEALLRRADVAETHWTESGYGVYGQDRAFLSAGDLQAMGAGTQHQMAAGRSNENSSPLPVMEESSFKVGRLLPEERREKIHRYMKKRNERNFAKKIKYACRKTLADSRPRVRGRFAKNDEEGELIKPCSSNHEFDDEEQVGVKDEDILDSDILAHISGVNSFAYNFALDSSWI